MITIPDVSGMDDETFMRHLELRHDNDLRMSFEVEPDREGRRMREPEVWRTYHDAMHRLYPRAYEHRHQELPRG